MSIDFYKINRIIKNNLIFILFSLFISANPYEGYILFTPTGNETTYLMDIDESIINRWNHTSGPASMPYLYSNDSSSYEDLLLYYPCISDNLTMETGGSGGRVEVYTWDGEKIWSYDLSDEVYQHHHDIEVLPNGNILMIVWERLYYSEWQALGRQGVNNNLNQMWTTAILEINPNFETGEGTIVWEWHIKDHLIQDIDPSLDNYGNISDHPELMDVNCGTVGSNGGPGGSSNGDWMHINAIDYNSNLDQIVLSSNYQNEIYIIDHSTTTEEASGHSGGNSGMGGDFLYRWGNPQNYGKGDDSDRILNKQHGVNWIDIGYPGEGNLLLFNNLHSSEGPISAVIEFIPPLNSNGLYELPDSEIYGPDSYHWLYQDDFFSLYQSGVFRQPNGNTLISVAYDPNNEYPSKIIEVTDNGEIVWEYNCCEMESWIARAQKYGYDYFNLELSGDINSDGLVNVQDIINLVSLILNSSYLEIADINQDSILNVQDIISLVSIILE
tara:strand:+ start:1485 stop:2978 length:1494 start_codon:yes stop_codon:yes gene_type:complete